MVYQTVYVYHYSPGVGYLSELRSGQWCKMADVKYLVVFVPEACARQDTNQLCEPLKYFPEARVCLSALAAIAQAKHHSVHC